MRGGGEAQVLEDGLRRSGWRCSRCVHVLTLTQCRNTVVDYGSSFGTAVQLVVVLSGER
jgi:hypothetical protein